jgi:hypothetical protein
LLLLVAVSTNKTNTTKSSLPTPFLLPCSSNSCITNNDVAPFFLGELTSMVRQPKVLSSWRWQHRLWLTSLLLYL